VPLLSLAYPRFWSAVGWLLVAGVVAGSLLPAPTVANLTFSLNDKVMHSGAYCLLMLWFSGLYRRSLYLAIGAVLLTLGVGLDFLQSFTRTRSLDWHDMVANAAGVVLGLVLAFYLLGGWCQRLERRLLS
jgi:VanZ family protein